MNFILISFFILPLLAFALSCLFKNHQEKMVSGIAITTTSIQIVLNIVLIGLWAGNNWQPLSQHLLTVYKSEELNFGLDLYYDKTSAVYALVAAILMFIVSIFSKYYMHRESGFKRFFNQFLLFYFGLNLVVIAGNFETLFLGWEIVGVMSFLLIAFYRERFLPVKNAMKVLSYYRIGDVAFVGAAWFSHHLFHSNVFFESLKNGVFLEAIEVHHPIQSLIIALLFVLAASIKSAQLPFSSWLPRAMEGPTVSSAIFYGSLSVHLGLFLLLRTYPIWQSIWLIKYILIFIGIATFFVASSISSVQPTAKTQIAYSSIAQISIMFIEVALGWHILALIHFACNAFLRTYQLLVSPSTMSYLIHKQFFQYDPSKKPMFHFLPKKLSNTLYMLGVKEWNLDFIWFRYIWQPLKKLGKSLHFLRIRYFEFAYVLLITLGILFYFAPSQNPFHGFTIISVINSIIALVLILVAWTERQSAIRAWIYVAMSQVFFMGSIVEQHTFTFNQIIIYLSGTIGAVLAGMWCLYQVKSKDNNIDLNRFHGHIYEHKNVGLLFLIASLTVVGFPISPTFLGFDILFSDIENNHKILLVCSFISFIMLEITVLRIYARVFLGVHSKTYHEVPYRNS